jgi:hypothetical protein
MCNIMPEEFESVPINEVRKLARKSIEDNMHVMNALADYDNREHTLMTAQPVNRYFTIRESSAIKTLNYTDSVTVIATSTGDINTYNAKAD